MSEHLNPNQFHYPESMEGATSHEQFTFGRAHSLHGAGATARVFGEGQIGNTPWPSVAKTKKGLPYDKDIVRRALSGPPQLEEFDPRHLHGTQPSVMREHVEYYMGDTYKNTGRTSADQDNLGNQHPFVYRHPDGRNIVLAGHHRGVAALLQGEPLRARTNPR